MSFEFQLGALAGALLGLVLGFGSVLLILEAPAE